MQMLVPRYLEVSLESLTREQEKFRSQMAQAFGATGFGPLEEQVRRNMEMFEKAFGMFAPFVRKESQPASPDKPDKPTEPSGDIDTMKRQLEEMQKRLDKMTNSDK
jgi:polyhydroxyalkanoate synthesis regulator protein